MQYRGPFSPPVPVAAPAVEGLSLFLLVLEMSDFEPAERRFLLFFLLDDTDSTRLAVVCCLLTLQR